ncbi:MAG: hypothetical protein AAF645_21255 [Myxococcota bacterium]
MIRRHRLLAAILASAALFTGLVVVAPDADAQRRRRRAEPEPQTPHTDAIAGAMGAVEWGWNRDELVDHFSKQLREEYRPRIHKARDAMTADRIRHEMNQHLRRIRDSYVEFDGRTTGHDTSFLRDEFTHRNNESMVRIRSDNADDFYFFINNRLWKWYRAFDASVFAGADFEQFSEALSGRFGAPGRSRRGALVEGADPRTWLEWQDDDTRLRALDNNQFYGFYCLVFEHKDTLRNLDTLRRNQRARRGGHSLVDAVTSEGDAESADGDEHADIADRITGRVRRGAGRTPSNMGSSMRPASDPIGNDPLRGLD